VVELDRTIPNIATLNHPNQPTHDISLPRRSLRDCLAEELRRLDPDFLFGDVIRHGVAQLEKYGTGSGGKPLKASHKGSSK
jgi:hypothetical protein